MSWNGFAIALTALAVSACAGLQDRSVGSYPSELKHDEFMAEMADLATPGPEHQRLQAFLGQWDLAIQVRYGADEEWQEASGQSAVESRLGDRAIIEEMQLTVAGEPYHVYQVYGFDNLQQRWFSVRMGTMSTWPTYASGESREDGVVTVSGRWSDAATPGGRPFHVDVNIVSNDRIESSIWDTIDGEPVEIMKIVRTRRS